MQPPADADRDRAAATTPSATTSSAAAAGAGSSGGTSRSSGVARARPLRNVGKRFDEAGEAVWIVDAQDRLIYLNATAAQWLQVESAELLGRVCHVAALRKTAVERALASLAVPLDLLAGHSLVRQVAPEGLVPQNVRYSRHGAGGGQFVLAITGASVPEASCDRDLQVAAALRDRLEPWRRDQTAAGLALTAGASPHAIRLRAQIQLAAAAGQPLAICGPRGCGGEAVARLIHQLATTATEAATGPPVDRPADLIVVDTPLMDADLLDATLAPAVHALRRSSTARITLVLRSVDEAAVEIQQRLVDFARQAQDWAKQTQDFAPQTQGKASTRSAESLLRGSVPPRVRLIGLLNRSLAEARQQGKLTERLALPLSVLEIAIPPLGQRPDDLPLIATAALENRYWQQREPAGAATASGRAAGPATAQAFSQAAVAFSQAAIDRLLLYPWPENWEELQAAVRHAARVAGGSMVQVNDLPLAIRSFRASSTAVAPPIVQTDLDDAVRQFEREKIELALQAADGNRAQAARILGISRARLLRKCQELASEDEAPPGAGSGKPDIPDQETHSQDIHRTDIRNKERS